jgi:integrase/recombinase XerD
VTAPDLSGAQNDVHLVQLWLAQRPETTRRVYAPVAEEFLKGLTIRELDAAQLIAWSEALQGEPSTRSRKVSTIKSLLTFAWRTGYTLHNVGRVLRCVPIPSKVAERILEEPEMALLFAGAPEGRDRTFLRLMYATGARVSELCKLRWVDFAQPGRMTVLGKGAKKRTLLVPQAILTEVQRLKPAGTLPTAFVFVSKRNPTKPLDPRDAREIVYQAKRRSKLDRKASPHVLRHSHATHSLDHGCPIHILQQSMGHASVATTSVYLHVRPNKGSSTYIKI